MKKIKPENILISRACFRQRVSLPSRQVQDLSRDELAAALAFEIEPFSGIPRDGAEIAWKELPESDVSRSVFDVIQIRADDLRNAVREGRSRKKKIAAVTAEPDGTSGERVEDLPYIPIPRPAILSPGAAPLSIIAAIVLIGIIACDAFLIRSENERLKKDIAVRSVLQGRRTRLLSEISATEKSAAAILQSRKNEEAAAARVETLRSSWRIVLDSLGSACMDESFIKSVSPSDDGRSAVISGTSMSPDAVARTFVRLTKALKDSDSEWTATPGDITSSPGSSTATFTCTLTPADAR